jgi:osmotically-inducible protein OsmY
LVAQRLSIDWTTRRQQISVSVQHRVVILGGLVGDEQARQVAAELACDVPGVHDICNMIRVNRRSGRRR